MPGHVFPPPPPLVHSEKAERLIDPKRLSQAQRRMLWRGIQRLDPALAELLKTDQDIESIKQRFDGSIRFPASDVVRYLEAGQSAAEENNL